MSAGDARASAADAGPEPAGAERMALLAWLRLLACTTLVDRELRARLRADFGTTLPRFDVLAQLDAAAREGTPGLTMGALSRRLMVTNGNLTALVERLVGEGLLDRARAPGDRRRQVVRLTPAGQRALDAMAPRHHDWIAGLFAGLTAGEVAQLHALLGRLRGSIRDATSGGTT